MPHKCCVPTCRGNYKNGPTVSAFSFPENEDLRKKWIIAIRRENFIPTKHSKVCELHFKPTEILRESSAYDEKTGKFVVAPIFRPKLKEGSVPSLFPDGPDYLSRASSSRESPDKKRIKREMNMISEAIEASMKTKYEYDNKTTFNNFEEMQACLKMLNLTEFWSTIIQKDKIVFIHIDFSEVPEIKVSLVVDCDLNVKAFSKNSFITNLQKFRFPQKVDNIHMLDEMLKELMKFDSNINDKILNNIQTLTVVLSKMKTLLPNKEAQIDFLSEQIEKLRGAKVHYRYSSDDLIFSSLLYSISPHSYKFLRSSGKVIMPHPETIHRICSRFDLNPINEQFHENFLGYIKQKFLYLEEKDKIIILMLDEIHLKPMFDFKGGYICGMASNTVKVAKSAHVFMIRSLLSSFTDVVYIHPANNLDADELFLHIKNVIIGLEKIGFKNIAVVTDNNSINKKAMQQFAKHPITSFVYPHPVDSSRPLFFLIDSVHLIKSIRNNWLNQKNSEQCMFYPSFEKFDEIQTASFFAIKKLHELESGSIVKYGYGLTMKALCPSGFERQNVKLALQVFDKRIAEALMVLGNSNNIQNYKGTADYVKVINTWWTIVNVGSPFKGQHKNDVYQEPLTVQLDDARFIFLTKFIDWLDAWKEAKCSTGTLTRETHEALRLTTYGLIELTRYCTEELGFKYILPSKLQTDILEKRFGKYRQLAGCQHHVSIRQVYETESKLRLQNFLPYVKSSAYGNIPLNFSSIDNDKINPTENVLKEKSFKILVESSDISEIKEMPLLTFIAGYCCHRVLKHFKCDSCKNNITLDRKLTLQDDTYEWIRTFDRGLSYPHPTVLTVVVYNFIVVQKLISDKYEKDFMQCVNHRTVVHNTTLNILAESELFLETDDCINNHSNEVILNLIISSSTNIFLNNYCKKINDQTVSCKNLSKVRKLKTLKK